VNRNSRADVLRMIIGFAILLPAISVAAWGCQNECVIIATTKRSAVLEDADGNPLSKASITIRDASSGQDCRCGKFGPIVKRLRTDKRGHFELNELRAGDYWVTYRDSENGESFYIRIENGKASRDFLELELDHFGGSCFLVDVERNATKPPSGWPKPRQE